MTRPSTARLSSICTVTSIFIPLVAATMSPNPTVANTVTVKYSAVTWSRIWVNESGLVSEFDR